MNLKYTIDNIFEKNINILNQIINDYEKKELEYYTLFLEQYDRNHPKFFKNKKIKDIFEDKTIDTKYLYHVSKNVIYLHKIVITLRNIMYNFSLLNNVADKLDDDFINIIQTYYTKVFRFFYDVVFMFYYLFELINFKDNYKPINIDTVLIYKNFITENKNHILKDIGDTELNAELVTSLNKIASHFGDGIKNYLTKGYKYNTRDINQDMNNYGLVGIKYLLEDCGTLFNSLIIHIDVFKDKKFGFILDDSVVNFETCIDGFKNIYLNKTLKEANIQFDKYLGEHLKNFIIIKKQSNKKLTKKTMLKIYNLIDQINLVEQNIDKLQFSDQNDSYYTKVRDISDYRDFKTQTDREPQDFIAQIKLKNIGGKQNMSKYKYVTENSLGKAVNNSRARELANNYNRLTDKMIGTEKKIGGIQKLAIYDLSKSQNGYVRMRGGEQQTINYNNLIKQYQLMAIKQNNIINEIKNIKNHY